MAEDELENNGEDGEQEEGGSKPGRKKKLIIALAILLLLVVGSVAVTLWIISDASEAETDTETSEATEQPAREAAIYFPLKPEFITSFEVRGRQRYMQVEMNLMLRNNSAVKDIELHMPAIRNALVILLRGQIYAELQTPEGKELLRQQALNTVQQVLEAETGQPVIEQVLFTNLVLQ
ncbi:flagellar basal body-associated FliL family protein [uncultured Gilvimarinus sp.]|uniref:flagellar basal body-associated FliL family protein n=1 Tax=uncultured Gilvimarinus sp. TaxID=1689143 RepID=UPI0030EC4D59|tara:strand:- start:371 stop:904 length:534 start_codon:yes stop_codon:yes gene_type:complete